MKELAVTLILVGLFGAWAFILSGCTIERVYLNANALTYQGGNPDYSHNPDPEEKK